MSLYMLFSVHNKENNASFALEHYILGSDFKLRNKDDLLLGPNTVALLMTTAQQQQHKSHFLVINLFFFFFFSFRAKQKKKKKKKKIAIRP